MENDELKNENNNTNNVLCVVKIDGQKHGTGKDEIYCNWYICPKCDNVNVMFGDNYCSKCGCKFEWTGLYE